MSAVQGCKRAVTATSDQYEYKANFVSQISQPTKFTEKWFCIHNLNTELSFQEKRRVCKSTPILNSLNILILKKISTDRQTDRQTNQQKDRQKFAPIDSTPKINFEDYLIIK